MPFAVFRRPHARIAINGLSMDLAYLAHRNPPRRLHHVPRSSPMEALGSTRSNTSSQFPGHPSAARYDNDTKWGLPEVPTRNDLDAAHHRLTAVSCTGIPDVPEPHRTAVCPTASEFQGHLWPTLVGCHLDRRVRAQAAWGMRWPILRVTNWQE